MKLQTILPALLLAATASMSFSAYSATDADKTQAAEAQADNPVAKTKAKRMKPHSHMQEKTGVPQTMPTGDATEGNPNAAQDKSKHFHPRDGK